MSSSIDVVGLLGDSSNPSDSEPVQSSNCSAVNKASDNDGNSALAASNTEDDNEEPSNSTSFAPSLKYHDDNGVVIAYDHNRLELFFLCSSSMFDPSLDLHLIVSELFCGDEYWKSQDLLFGAITHFGKIHCFNPIKKSNKIMRNRLGKRTYKRDYVASGLKAQCTFQFTLHAKYNSKSPAASSGKSTPRPDWNRETYIWKAYYNHSEGCRLSAQNLVTTMKHTGGYVKKPASQKCLLCVMWQRRVACPPPPSKELFAPSFLKGRLFPRQTFSTLN